VGFQPEFVRGEVAVEEKIAGNEFLASHCRFEREGDYFPFY